MKKKKKKPSFGNISEEFKDEIIKTNNIIEFDIFILYLKKFAQK